MNYVLFDEARRSNFLPLTFLRPVADIRFGILTIREKWERYLKCKTSTLTEEYLSAKFPLIKEKDNVIINGAICPNNKLIEEISRLKAGQALVKGETVIAMFLNEKDFEVQSGTIEEIETETDFLEINNTWDIFAKNGEAIIADFELITKGRKSKPVPAHSIAIASENIFIEEGAEVLVSTLNATDGPIYLGKDSIVMEGSHIRGPFALCDHAQTKMAAKIYGSTTIGPYSKVGGEVNNSVIFGYSNKAHDGFLGHSVIGEWCNLGADTNTSNLKNTYDSVKLWSYTDEAFVDTEQQFCGLIMGDHSKCGINTMFNTGTVVGVSSNIFGSGFQRNFVSSFKWGGVSGFTTFQPQKAIEVAMGMYKRRDLEFTDIDAQLIEDVYNLTHNYRRM
ncbi:MAG: glucose-1-phosphate thymidylyltransferase [Bacteroidetes bacterium HGW-Bacteroidetes-9]|nr:MAG: glucose-1-phosphate thymidylyltransferase [Bacteroidetes bacterium HGW-Bacteroidetes-9]